MSTDDPARTPAEPRRLVLDSKSESTRAVDQLLGLARSRIQVFDPDGRQFLLGARDRCDSLFAFLRRPARPEFELIVHDSRWLLSEQPRFASLCGQFGGQVRVRITLGEAQRLQECFFLVDGRHVLRRAVAAQARGVLILDDDASGHAQAERFEEIRQHSEPVSLGSVAGLG